MGNGLVDQVIDHLQDRHLWVGQITNCDALPSRCTYFSVRFLSGTTQLDCVLSHERATVPSPLLLGLPKRIANFFNGLGFPCFDVIEARYNAVDLVFVGHYRLCFQDGH